MFKSETLLEHLALNGVSLSTSSLTDLCGRGGEKRLLRARDGRWLQGNGFFQIQQTVVHMKPKDLWQHA